MTYDELLKEADSHGLIVKEKPLRGNKGRIKGNRIAIKNNLKNNVEKACVLAEELGHYHTTAGDILDQSDIRNRQQEIKARRWAYKRLIGIIDIINAYKGGVKNRYELAEYLNLTEEFIEDALKYYNQKYGMLVQIDNYVVYFEPLSVLEVW